MIKTKCIKTIFIGIIILSSIGINAQDNTFKYYSQYENYSLLKVIADCFNKLASGETFLLSEHDLNANKNIALGKLASGPVIINALLKKFRKNKIKNYNVTLTRKTNGKKYYGNIAFFNTSKVHANEAVSRYREIHVGSEYFESATSGRTAMIYEYFNDGNSLISQKVPTWVMLISDEPFN